MGPKQEREQQVIAKVNTLPLRAMQVFLPAFELLAVFQGGELIPRAVGTVSAVVLAEAVIQIVNTLERNKPQGNL